MKQYNKIVSNRILKGRAPAYFFARKGNDTLSLEGREEALKIHDRLVSKLQMHTIIQVYEGKELRLVKDSLILPTGEIFCKWFRNLELMELSEVLLFLVSIEDLEYEYSDVLEQYYASMWLTTYLDCYRQMLLKAWGARITRKYSKKVLSTPLLGPGYFTMGIDQLESFYRIIPCNEIGVSLNNSKVLQPQNTCCGMFLSFHEEGEVVKDELRNPCRYCQSNRVDCSCCFYQKPTNFG
ncbi:MAG TPA: hypothetical protein VHQ24_12290 [Lachnospiraceae bacterium]|nr:hypothetical protein [Lachnospiraceae bacterium]